MQGRHHLKPQPMPSPNLDTDETATAPQSERAQLRLRERVFSCGIKRGLRIAVLDAMARQRARAQVNLADALQNQRVLQHVCGAALIRRTT